MLRKPPVYSNRIELLQGILDLLILEILQLGPRHGYGISQAIRAGSGDVLRRTPGRYTPRCIAWNAPNGSPQNGRSRRTSRT